MTTDHEIGIIGCCLAGGSETTIEAAQLISSKQFGREDCREAFQVLESLLADGAEVDQARFYGQWRKLNPLLKMPDDILSAPDSVASPAQLSYFLDSVLDSDRRRKIKAAATAILAKVDKEAMPVDDLMGEIQAIVGGEEIKGYPIKDGKTCTNELIDDLENRFHLQGKLSGVPTGFDRLDAITNGLQYGEQSIIGARPSVGKTAMMLNIVSHACFTVGIPTLIFTLEMPPKALLRRMLADLKNVDMQTLKAGTFDQGTFATFTTFTVMVSKSPLYIVNGVRGIDINRISAIARRAVRKYGVKLFCVDYLQKIKPGSRHEKRTYEVGNVSESLKALAETTNTAWLTMAQLNRDSEKDKTPRPPRISDLADSAQIERDGDLIALLHRARTKDDPTGENAMLIIGKQRDGETGVIPLTFNGKYCRFENRRNSPIDNSDIPRPYHDD